MKLVPRTHAGLTLVELVIYVAMTSLILGSVVICMHLALQSRAQQSILSEVEDEGVRIMSLISGDIRNANTIIVPAVAGSGNVLQFTNPKYPGAVRYELSGTDIYLRGAPLGDVKLNSSLVSVVGVTFERAPSTFGVGNVRIRLQLSWNGPSPRQEFKYTQTFITSATTRP